MNTIKKLYREFFGLQEQSEKSQSMFHVSDDDVTNMQKMANAAKQLKTALGEEEIIDEAELLNHMGDYKGGVEYVVFDPAQAKATAADISQWAQKKGFTIVQQTISPSGKVGYFYFRLGENPYKESKRIQGYISQLPMIKHFRFNVKNQETPEQPKRREI
jgi:hypothetical protein